MLHRKAETSFFLIGVAISEKRDQSEICEMRGGPQLLPPMRDGLLHDGTRGMSVELEAVRSAVRAATVD
jgi:hypothetical protein